MAYNDQHRRPDRPMHEQHPIHLPPFNPLSAPPTEADHSHSQYPKVGQTRCYWALLSSDLCFLFLDPVLQDHLAAQASSLIGKSVLDFVHPDEQKSASDDLSKVLESRTLHGSITRVRYARLSRVRKLMGFDGVLEVVPDVDLNKIVYDQFYMAIDLVINLAAEGLVLCFLHAVNDNIPEDNDESLKTSWSNWCGSPTGGITPEHYAVLYQRLSPLQNLNPSPPSRVFQILLNSSERPILFSWPPEALSEEYGRLAKDVQMPFPGQGHPRTGNSASDDAKTSCTRRYKSQQPMSCADGVLREIESIFIPYGCIIFACHKTVSARAPGPNTPLVPSSHLTPSLQQHPSMQPGSYYSSDGGAFYDAQQPPQSHYAGYAGQRSLAGPASPYQSSYSQPSGQGALAMGSHLAPHDGWSQGPGMLPPPHYGQQQQWPPGIGAPTYALDTAGGARYSNAPSPTNSNPPSSSSSSAGVMGEVPPARPRASRLSPGVGAREANNRAGGNPPSGVQKCANCKTKTSPEWRKGPSGKKDLCNACGLRFARSRAKKEGVSVQRRRKDKGSGAERAGSKKPSESRAGSAYPMAQSPGGAGSPGGVSPMGDEPYHQQQQQQMMMMGNNLSMPGVGELTPSPSPPTPTHLVPNTNASHYYAQAPYSSSGAGGYRMAGNGMAQPSYERGGDQRERERDARLPPTPISAEPQRARHHRAEPVDAMYVHGQA